MKALLNSLIGIGVFLFIGTAGASDNGSISFNQILLQIFISVTLIIFGYVGLKYLNVKQKRTIHIVNCKKSKLSQAA